MAATCLLACLRACVLLGTKSICIYVSIPAAAAASNRCLLVFFWSRRRRWWRWWGWWCNLYRHHRYHHRQDGVDGSRTGAGLVLYTVLYCTCMSKKRYMYTHLCTTVTTATTTATTTWQLYTTYTYRDERALAGFRSESQPLPLPLSLSLSLAPAPSLAPPLPPPLPPSLSISSCSLCPLGHHLCHLSQMLPSPSHRPHQTRRPSRSSQVSHQ
jgi:hypothetical protein